MNAKRIGWLQFLPFLLLLLVGGFASQSAVAGIVGTDTILSGQAGMAEERAQLEALLDREDVQDRLVEYGVSPEEATERVAALSNEEVQQLVQDIDTLPAGGDVLTILLVVLLLILIL